MDGTITLIHQGQRFEVDPSLGSTVEQVADELQDRIANARYITAVHVDQGGGEFPEARLPVFRDDDGEYAGRATRDAGVTYTVFPFDGVAGPIDRPWLRIPLMGGRTLRIWLDDEPLQLALEGPDPFPEHRGPAEELTQD